MDPPAVQYAKTPDGLSIAYGVSGSGRPLVFLPLTFSHVQLFWTGETVLLAWLRGLAARFRLIQYDGRGQGMSSRGLSPGHSGAHELLDLEAVIERLGLDRFILLARGPMGHAAVRYAAAHPDRVEALILFSLPASGAAWPAAFARRLAAEDWDLFLQSFAAFDGRLVNAPTSVPRLSQTVTQRDWAHLIRNWISSDVRPLLGSVQTPALVLHPRDVLQPHPEESMKLAAALPNARMILTDGANQLGDAAQGLEAVDEFIAGLPRHDDATHSIAVAGSPLPQLRLSVREVEVLRLIAAGRSNQQIAEELVISLSTVMHHVSHILEKTGSANRTEAAAFAHRAALD